MKHSDVSEGDSAGCSGSGGMSGALNAVHDGVCSYMTADPFAEDDGDEFGSKTSNYIHIRIQQRNGRKTLTTVQGLPQELDFKRIIRAFKKVRKRCACAV